MPRFAAPRRLPAPAGEHLPAATAAVLLACLAACPASPARAAVPSYLQAEDPNAGFIYATVTWPDGEKATGFLRWEDEEAFWDDLFHSGQRDLPFLEHLDRDELLAAKRQRFFQEHGLLSRLAYALHEDDGDAADQRVFLAQMGDLTSLEIHDGQDDFALTCDGSRLQIGGYANDAGSDLLLYEEGQEPREIEWNDLTEIAFAQAPAGLAPYAARLYGTVESDAGSFTGFVQWDKSECLSSDVLDGEQAGKPADVAFADIRSIAKVDRSSCDVTRKDGSTVRLSGTNDVDHGNRGIVVQDPSWGRVSIPWERFAKVTFQDADRSGHGRGRFGQAAELRGTVTAADGTTAEGRLVLDLAKAWRWNVLTGSDGDLDYEIPMSLVRRLERRDDGSCAVTLADGKVLQLAGGDFGPDGAGMIVIPGDGGKARHVPWDRVAGVDFMVSP